MHTHRKPGTNRRYLVIFAILMQVWLTTYGTVHAAPVNDKSFVIGEVSNIPVTQPQSTTETATPSATATTSANVGATTNGVINDRRLSLHAELEKLGYVSGQNVTYMFDPAAFTPDKIDVAAQKMVAANVDVIIAYGTAAAISAKKAAAGTNIPIVFVGSLDPVQSGLVKSLQNTEGNVTGVGSSSDVYAKQLEWLLAIAPNVKRIYIPLAPPTSTTAIIAQSAVKSIQAYATKVGVELVTPTLTSDDEVKTAIDSLSGVDAIMLTAGSPGLVNFIKAGIDHKLPLTTAFPNIMDLGPLMSYNITEASVGATAARYVDRVLRGAKPSDLPVELASGFLAINLKTAQTIGLNISNDILQQATIIVR